MELRIYSSEEALIKGCQKQRKEAQRRLFERYSGLMNTICRRYIAETSEADSILIEGFHKIFMSVKDFRGDGSFEGWMKRIMVNCCLSYLRKNKSIHLKADLSLAESIPDDSIGDTLEKEDLLKMIERLPAGYRTVFNLFAIEGYSHKEIGNMLNISEGASKSQLSRARGLLQKYVFEMTKELKLASNETSRR